MNQKDKLPRLAEVLESGHGVTLTQDFPEVKVPVFWGPNQKTTEGFYVEPLLQEWHEYAIMAIPRVVRFNYNSESVDTEDYSDPVPPPPPPPAGSTVAWQIISQNESHFPGSCPDGSTAILVTWGLVVTNPEPPAPGSNIYGQVREVACCGDPTICACHPDCTFGGTEGPDENDEPTGDYEPYIYSYPCGHFPAYPNGGFADGCPDPNGIGFGGAVLNPSAFGQH